MILQLIWPENILVHILSGTDSEPFIVNHIASIDSMALEGGEMYT